MQPAWLVWLLSEGCLVGVSLDPTSSSKADSQEALTFLPQMYFRCSSSVQVLLLGFSANHFCKPLCVATVLPIYCVLEAATLHVVML